MTTLLVSPHGVCTPPFFAPVQRARPDGSQLNLTMNYHPFCVVISPLLGQDLPACGLVYFNETSG